MIHLLFSLRTHLDPFYELVVLDSTIEHHSIKRMHMSWVRYASGTSTSHHAPHVLLTILLTYSSHLRYSPHTRHPLEILTTQYTPHIDEILAAYALLIYLSQHILLLRNT